MTYSEKLLLPEWAHRRAEIIYQRLFTCEDCGFKGVNLSDFEVHHHYYEGGKGPVEYPDDCLSCLCPPCHRARQKLEDSGRVALGKLFARLNLEGIESLIFDLVEKAASLQRSQETLEEVEEASQ